MADSLKTYRKKRDFKVTPEPAEGGDANEAARAFVIQKHWASRLHYDFRLELDGAMKSWAVPKGPSYDPAVKRMAVQVEDHPIAYNQFEGQIPEGQYGAGKVIIWDEGRWMPVGDARKGYRDGHLKFELQGTKMQGRWALVRMKGKESDKQPAWLLIKDRDDFARREREFSVVDEMPDSVVPLRKKTPAKARPQAGPKEDRAISKGDEAALPGQAAELPASLKPQLATLADGIPPGSEDWLYELKFDGYRLLARLDGDTVTLHTRNGHDWSAKLPHLVDAFGRLPAKCAWVDGEAVVLDKQGVPQFPGAAERLRRRSHRGHRVLRLRPAVHRRTGPAPGTAARAPGVAGAVDGRKRRRHHLRFSEAFDQTPADLVASACKMGLEGIIAKRQSAAYVSRRSDNWLKIKCGRRQEFVIVGYTAPQGTREGLGALLLAVHEDDGALRYAGKVGTGFDRQGLLSLQQKLARIETRDKPVTGGEGRGVQWVKPELIAEVAFGDWTSGGHIRHAVFQGLRTDKPAREITRERAAAVTRAPTAKAQAKPAGKIGKLTHPERVIDPSTGLTKLDLARYYGLVAPLLLEHLNSRPVSFLRAPAGIQGELFFQKHLEAAMPGVKSLPPKLDPGHPPLLEVPTAEAVLSAVQMNVVEFHTWNAVKTAIGKPDRMLSTWTRAKAWAGLPCSRRPSWCAPCLTKLA